MLFFLGLVIVAPLRPYPVTEFRCDMFDFTLWLNLSISAIGPLNDLGPVLPPLLSFNEVILLTASDYLPLEILFDK